MKKEKNFNFLKAYHEKMQPFRDDFARRFQSILGETDEGLLALFFIQFCSQGVAITEPVPRWITMAGDNTKAMGFDKLGQALVTHAHHEAGHHLMMVEDTQAIVDWFNKKYSKNLDPSTFLNQPSVPGAEEYKKLHEDCIKSETPYAQIAIEFEIEQLSVAQGPHLCGHVAKVLGKDFLKNLSFIEDHVKLDVGHTEFNSRVMNEFLESYPSALDSLVAAGKKALDSYALFLEDCMKSAQAVKYN